MVHVGEINVSLFFVMHQCEDFANTSFSNLTLACDIVLTLKNRVCRRAAYALESPWNGTCHTSFLDVGSNRSNLIELYYRFNSLPTFNQTWGRHLTSSPNACYPE